MDILFLLIPLSVVIALFIVAGFWWAVDRNQFVNLDEEGQRIVDED